MPQQSESQFSGLLGGPIEAAFGSRKPPKPIYRDEAIRNLERNLTSDINIGRNSLNNALTGYRRSINANQPLIRDATLESDAALRGILQRQSSPFGEYQQLGDYLFSKTQQVPDRVLNYLGNALEVNNLSRGLNPGAASSYETLLRGGLASRAALDANRASLGALTQAFPQLQNAIMARDQTTMNILPQRLAGLENLSNRRMLPVQAQFAGLRDLQGLAMGQNALNMGNLQGYQPVENWANRVGAVGRSVGTNISQILDWAQQAASIYGSAMGGGMGGAGGGGLGSLFGGGGGGQAATPARSAYPGMDARGAAMLNQPYYGDIPTTNYYS